MRILHLSAGTGSYFCGTCMRDNALVLALRREGHDASLMPLYLPFTLDEDDATDCPLFFGGINVYLQQKSGFFRRTPRWIDRMLDGNRLLKWSASFAHLTKPEEVGELTENMLLGGDGRQAKELRRMLAWIHEQQPYDLVALSNLLLVGLAPDLRRRLHVPVVCGMQGEDHFLDDLPGGWPERCWDLIAERAGAVDRFLAVSAWHAEAMAGRLGIDRAKVGVVHNGIDPDGFGPEAAPGEVPTIGFLAHCCPEKGLDLLADAFVALRGRGLDCRLLVAGSVVGGDRAFVDGCRHRIEEAGFAGDAEWHENVSRAEKQDLLRRMSLLCVPTRLKESFGLYLLEAGASGVPALGPATGAVPEVLAATGGGETYDPGPDDAAHAAALALALEAAIADPAALAARGREASAVVRRDFSVDSMASRTADEYARTLAGTAAT